MNNSLNEYLRFNFELNIELNHFLARFNVKMNNQNVSATPTSVSVSASVINQKEKYVCWYECSKSEKVALQTYCKKGGD